MTEYPIERRLALLRSCDGIRYEERREVWNQLSEYSSADPTAHRELVSSVWTGRVFELVRTVSPEAIEDDPSLGAREGEHQWIDPEWFLCNMFRRVVGLEGREWTGVSEDWIPEKPPRPLTMSERISRDIDREILGDAFVDGEKPGEENE